MPSTTPALVGPSDAALVARVAGGDADAFAALYDRHSRAVHTYALARTGRVAEAEEVCQDAFLALWRHAERFDPRRGGVRAWLVGIARHLAIDRLRAQTRRGRAEGAAREVAAREPADDSVARIGMARAEAARVRRALDGLPSEQRDALLLVHAGGLSHGEVADVCGLPLGTVKGRLRLGLARLRDAVGEDAA